MPYRDRGYGWKGLVKGGEFSNWQGGTTKDGAILLTRPAPTKVRRLGLAVTVFSPPAHFSISHPKSPLLLKLTDFFWMMVGA